MRHFIRLIALAGLLFCIAWVCFAPGWESVATTIGTLVGFLTTFIEKSKDSPIKYTTSKIILSDRAKALLKEIDESTASQMKGISLMMIDAVRGFYRPFIWSNSLHGGISVDRLEDIGDTVSAVHELSEKGFLIFHSKPSKSLSYYRRTEMQT